MFDIMLIGDDAKSCEELKRDIDWSGMGATFLCQADRAEAAFEMCLKYRPEIVVAQMEKTVDVPLITKLQAEDGLLQFILITDQSLQDVAHRLEDIKNVSLLCAPASAQQINFCIFRTIEQHKAALKQRTTILASERDHIRMLFRQCQTEQLKRFLRSCMSHAADAPLSGELVVEYVSLLVDEALNAGLEPEQLEKSAKDLIKLFKSTDADDRVEAVLDLTEHLIGQIVAQRTANASHLIAVAKEYIEENISNDQLNLEQVSNYVGLSRIYFCKRFHRSEGISFSSYLKDLRIEMAKKLLLQKGMRVFEVGNAVGFSNPKYFSFVFKQETGLTPLEYQKKAQNN